MTEIHPDAMVAWYGEFCKWLCNSRKTAYMRFICGGLPKADTTTLVRQFASEKSKNLSFNGQRHTVMNDLYRKMSDAAFYQDINSFWDLYAKGTSK